MKINTSMSIVSLREPSYPVPIDLWRQLIRVIRTRHYGQPAVVKQEE
jgi:hypothetical protein